MSLTKTDRRTSQKPSATYFVLADDEAQMLHRTFTRRTTGGPRTRGATILVAVARAHVAFGIAKGDEDGGVERALQMRDWEIDVG